MHRVNVNFSDSQVKRLLKGHTVQVSASDLKKSSTTPILLNNKQFSTYKRSLKLEKGMRFQIAPELMQDNHTILGGSVKSFFRGVKKTVKSVSKAVGKELKNTGKEIKKSAKASAKSFAMDALASDDIKGYVKDNSKRRALEWAKDDALNHVRAGVTNSIVVGEKELEDALINNHGFDEDLARQMISAGSHRLSKKAFDELMNVDDALTEVAEGAGLKRGRDYTITKGGRLSFKGFLRKVRKVGKKILTVGRPILKPLANLAGQSLGAMVGGPAGAKIGGIVADGGYDAIQNGLGMRKRLAGGKVSVKKGSAEAKARMAKVRQAKKSGSGLQPAGHGYRGKGLSPAGYY